MQISGITVNYTNQPQFKAKFLDTPALRKVVDWAVKNNRFEELNEARKQIGYTAMKVRLEFDLGTNLEGYPLAIFRRHFPKSEYNPDTFELANYNVSKPILYQSRRKIDPIEYGFERIMQMSRHTSKNKMFRDIVINPPKYSD